MFHVFPKSFFNIHWVEACSLSNTKQIKASWGKKHSCAVAQIDMSHFPELIFSAPVIKTTTTISVISLNDSSLYFTSVLDCIYFNDSLSFSLHMFHIHCFTLNPWGSLALMKTQCQCNQLQTELSLSKYLRRTEKYYLFGLKLCSKVNSFYVSSDPQNGLSWFTSGSKLMFQNRKLL